MKPLRNSPIFRKQTERTQDEKTASMGRNAAQKVTKTAKNRAANEELRLYRLGDPPRDPHQRLFQNRTGQAPERAAYGGKCAVKVIEDVQDKYGNYCIIFNSTNLRLIYDWLHTHYSGNGFKFAIVIDLSIDCDYETPTETVVYFLDAITEEVLDYAGFKLANTDAT